MRIELISPAHPDPQVREVEKHGYVPPLGLALLAGLTPPDVEVTVTDEAFDPLNWDRQVDLVGITVMTSVAPRAFAIADRYLERGIPVVLGGIHPTLVPRECLSHATAIVQGDAELLWPQVVNDARIGRLQRNYKQLKHPSLAGLPSPRMDLIRSKGAYALAHTVQATRGCVHRCSFCTVASMYGGTFRTRPIAEVLRDVEQCNGKLFFFVDDNIVADPEYAKNLFREMIPLKAKWMTEMGLGVADDDELLALAARSGCKGVYIGFESISPHALKEVEKGRQQYRETPHFKEKIDRIRSHGIGVNGGFVIGFDSDTPDIFDRTLDFVLSSHLDLAQFQALNAFPGTPLFDKLTRQGRILHTDWSKYIWRHVTFKPMHMSPAQIEEGILDLYRTYYSIPQIAKRSLQWLRLGSVYSWIIDLLINLSYRKRGNSFNLYEPVERRADGGD